jgi:HPt (histidine-containing phosphotransfer) domain-containing protein
MTPTTLAPIPERTGPCHDHAALLYRIDNDLECLRGLLDLFEQDVEVRLRQLDQGIAGASSAAIAEAAHSIRGMLLVFSGDYAAGLAGALEDQARAGELAGAEGLAVRLRREIQALTAELEASLAPAPGGVV